MRTLWVLMFFLAWSASSAAAPPAGNHPIIGIWTWTVPGTGCSERYLLRPDGTTLVTAGEEVTESEFEIDAQPSASGFYKMVDTIVKGNGKKDCTGSITPVGSKSTNFIRFDPSGNVMVECQDESLNRCFGPLRKAGGQSL